MEDGKPYPYQRRKGVAANNLQMIYKTLKHLILDNFFLFFDNWIFLFDLRLFVVHIIIHICWFIDLDYLFYFGL